MIRLRRQIVIAVCLIPTACNDGRPTYLGSVSPIETVRQCCGKDLHDLPSDARLSLKNAIENIRSAKEPDLRSRAFEPRSIWEYSSGVLVLESEPNEIETETTSIRLIWLGQLGDVRAEVEFSTGPHCYLKNASVRSVAEFELPLLELDVDCREALKADYTRQVYSVIENRFDLIRLEGHDGLPRRNLYYAGNLACGPPPIEQSPEQWEADLYSSDRARVLRSLVWFAGERAAGDVSKDLHSIVGQPPLSILVKEVLARPAVRQRIRDLSRGDHEWERQQADLVLR